MRVVVRVKPGSSKGPLVESDDEGIVVFVREKAIDGAANEGVIKLMADHFDVPKSRVRVVRGHTARIKQVEIDD
ncbi:DUF167 domain-containing protein [Aurantimicrobium photophilum]|uniref:Uncharacterized protein n=1 Tax=Aurantimicrobium photophilum TaxID=1987356 RepID=A0A2Z3S0C6_9MICO|nr:DUF167 domain-containing protein [Aurantimicrobium photophilum]AWR21716.1 hypothetical protein AURMO_01122 [Aurantimicrobium photophilum]